MRLGFTYAVRVDKADPAQAIAKSGSEMWRVTTATVTAITKLFYDDQARKEVSGVVGSYEATRQSFQFDTVRALNVLAIISLSLAIVNLFPFLPLDGGHIFWAVVELIRRKPVPLYIMERSGIIGFMLVALIFVIGLSNDIGRLSGDGFTSVR
jgi:regulator of sigma E protease